MDYQGVYCFLNINANQVFEFKKRHNSFLKCKDYG